MNRKATLEDLSNPSVKRFLSPAGTIYEIVGLVEYDEKGSPYLRVQRAAKKQGWISKHNIQFFRVEGMQMGLFQ